MNFATITPTVDWLEAVLLLTALVVGLPVAVFCVREGWREFLWAMRDRSLIMRYLGPVQIMVALILFIVLMAIMGSTLVQMTVPSAINRDESTLDVVAALTARLKDWIVVAGITAVCVIMAWWRREADKLRRDASPTDEPTVVEAPVSPADAATHPISTDGLKAPSSLSGTANSVPTTTTTVTTTVPVPNTLPSESGPIPVTGTLNVQGVVVPTEAEEGR